VQPTYGALFDLPEDRLAIDPVSLRATDYEAQDPLVASRLRALASEAKRVFVMTDADRQGEFIAAQVRELCPQKPLIRLRLRDLSAEALRRALREPSEIDEGAATAGTVRRIVDRIIGYGFSTPRLSWHVGIVGRVRTAALAAFQHRAVGCGEWSGQLSGGLEARGTITNRSWHEAQRIEVLLCHSHREITRLPRERMSLGITPPGPCTFADALLEGRRRLGIPTRTGERLLQEAYQKGTLSYIRSDSAHLSPKARAMGLQLARASSLVIAPDPDAIHRLPTDGRSPRRAHDALHPTYLVDLALDPSAQSSSDGLLTLIGRRLAASLAAPVTMERERISPSALRQFLSDRLGESASEVDFQLERDLSPPPPWMQWLKRRDNPCPPRVEWYGGDATALSFLSENQFGRPSTQLRYVTSLIEDGFVNSHGNVTPLGQQALDYARVRAPFLLDPSRIAAVEALLDQNTSTSIPELTFKMCELIGLPLELAQGAISEWYAARSLPLPERLPLSHGQTHEANTSRTFIG